MSVAKKNNKSLRSSDPVPSVDFDTAMAKVTAKDQANINRYLESNPGDLWKRLFCVMAALSPHAIKTTGQLSVQFYVADGKHRLQIFAMEDSREGKLNLYIPDCIKEAVDGKLIDAPLSSEEPTHYPIRDSDGLALHIEQLTAATTMNAPEFFKHMLGWNRRAIRVALPVTASPVEVHAAEILCVLGAQLRVPQGAPAAPGR